jgi:hypothetical protein
MSLFGDLKRIFFGAKSVAKHQSERAQEAARAKGEEISEQVRERATRLEKDWEATSERATEQAKKSFTEFTDRVREEADHAAEKGQELKHKAESWLGERLSTTPPPPPPPAGDPLDEFSLIDDDNLDISGEPSTKSTIDFEAGIGAEPPHTKKAPSALAQTGDELLNQAARAGNEAKEKLKNVSEKVGEQVLKKGGELLDKAAAAGADLKGKASAKLGDLAQRAKEAAEQESLDDAIAQAKAAQEQAEARARAFDDQEGDRDTSGSTLSGTDSFFDRADRFAKGDYHNEGGKKMRIQEDPEYRKEDKTDSTLHGFSDDDGDGDPLIDDAILDEDDDK